MLQRTSTSRHLQKCKEIHSVLMYLQRVASGRLVLCAKPSKVAPKLSTDELATTTFITSATMIICVNHVNCCFKEEGLG